jgi:hypothetical protein
VDSVFLPCWPFSWAPEDLFLRQASSFLQVQPLLIELYIRKAMKIGRVVALGAYLKG